MDHSYEEIRKAALNILVKPEGDQDELSRYEHLRLGVARVLQQREETTSGRVDILSSHDNELFPEVFWDLFRQGIITLGSDDANREFPFFRLSTLGRKIIEGQEPYFFHDLSSYEKVITENVPNIEPATLIYLKEAMQAFLSGCVLSSSVMIGVATEHSLLILLEAIEKNAQYGPLYQNVFTQKTILSKLNKFRNILEQNKRSLPSEVKEDLDTNFSGILTMIRNFRNESGHPTGKIISREQCYVLLHLFITCCKKIYQLIDFFE